MDSTTIVPDDLLDRYGAAFAQAVDAIGGAVSEQRRAMTAAVQAALIALEAASHITQSVVRLGLTLTDRATTTSAQSIGQFSVAMMQPVSEVAPAGNGRSSTRHSKEAAAA